MQLERIRPATPGHIGLGYAELLCVIRLQEIALAGPQPVDGLRAMIDALVTVPSIFRAVIVVPEADGSRVRYLAHVGKRGFRAHAPVAQAPSPMLAKALRDGEPVQLMRSDDSGLHLCVNLPIRGDAQVLGALGVGLKPPAKLEPWREVFFWSVADLMALLLLAAAEPDPSVPRAPSGPARLTRRQREVLLALVDGAASNQEIGARLGLSPLTVKAHLQGAFRSLGVRRRGDAIRLLMSEHAGWLARERQLLPARRPSE